MTKEETIAYLAGFFDGEGCIRVARNGAGVKRGYSPVHRLVIVASQKTEHDEPLKLLRETFGGCICNSSVPKHCKPVSQWVISGAKAKLALEAMIPYLLVKKLPAMLALAFQTYKEMVLLYRKPRTKVAAWEITLNDDFMKLFSMMNGNKPLTDEILPPVQVEEEVVESKVLQ